MPRVVLSRSARQSVHALANPLAEAVLEAFALLEHEPEAGYPLRGRLRGLWSLRIGSYRIIYELREADSTVRVVAIRHRAEAYRSDPR